MIVGASLAGARAAEGARAAGWTGQVVLVGAEPDRPYERPGLSKGFLQGKTGRDDLFVHPTSWYAEHGVELVLGARVTAVDVAAGTVSIDGHGSRDYTSLILTTGASPVPLSVPGSDLPGVRYLRTVTDSEALRNAFALQPRVVIVGGGWIGMEAAAAARLAECQVHVVEPAELPLLRVLGKEIAGVYADLHRDHGVTLHLGVGVDRIVGAGHVEQVALTDGTLLDADTVLVGIGVRPEVGLAAAAGLAVDDGVLVDAGLRTSAADVWAAGDCARAELPYLGRRVRVDHWANARNQGEAAGRSAAGEPVSYDRVPYVFSDQYDVGMEFSGWFDSYDELLVRGDLAKREFVPLWRRAGRVLAGMNVNVWDVSAPIQRLIHSGAVVDAELLADPAVPLEDLAPAGG
jgi:3-phenylpropionate/trans-cinnamate dioxygenase ferredoxin reductase subunit